MTCSKELEPAQTQNQPADKTSKRNRQGNETKHKEEEKERGQKQKKYSKKKKRRRDEEETGKGKKEKKRERAKERGEREKEREREGKQGTQHSKNTHKRQDPQRNQKKNSILTLRAGNKKVIPEFCLWVLPPYQPSPMVGARHWISHSHL